MYDRTFDDRTLTFEPSGGLLDAALVMRDRETDSWWAIMQGRAIGGPMQDRTLEEVPGTEKTTWGDWRRRHPGTRVLVVDGRTHDPQNPYDHYFSSDGTFRGMKSPDGRLPAKEPIFAFRIDDQAFALRHRDAEGGRLPEASGAGTFRAEGAADLFVFRERGAPVFASTRAWRVPRGLVTRLEGGYVASVPDRDAGPPIRLDTTEGLERLSGIPGVEVLPGLDTYWYTWVAAHRETRLLE